MGALRLSMSLPRPGKKAVVADGDWLQQRKVTVILKKLQELIDLPRVVKSGSLQHLEWSEARDKLTPEEILSMMEMNRLHITRCGVTVSLQEARCLLLSSHAATATDRLTPKQYATYATLTRTGYHLSRAEPYATLEPSPDAVGVTSGGGDSAAGLVQRWYRDKISRIAGPPRRSGPALVPLPDPPTDLLPPNVPARRRPPRARPAQLRPRGPRVPPRPPPRPPRLVLFPCSVGLYDLPAVGSFRERAAQRRHLEDIGRLAERTRWLVRRRRYFDRNLATLRRLVFVYNVRYEARVELDDSLNVIEYAGVPYPAVAAASESRVAAVERLSAALEELERRGLARPRHRRAFDGLLRTFGRSGTPVDRIVIDSSSDSDRDANYAPPPAKRLRNPFADEAPGGDVEFGRAERTPAAETALRLRDSSRGEALCEFARHYRDWPSAKRAYWERAGSRGEKVRARRGGGVLAARGDFVWDGGAGSGGRGARALLRCVDARSCVDPWRLAAGAGGRGLLLSVCDDSGVALLRLATPTHGPLADDVLDYDATTTLDTKPPNEQSQESEPEPRQSGDPDVAANVIALQYTDENSTRALDETDIDCTNSAGECEDRESNTVRSEDADVNVTSDDVPMVNELARDEL